MNRNKWIVACLVVAMLLAGGLSANAEGPWSPVRFLRVLVNAWIEGDLTVDDDVSVGDGLTVTGDTTLAGALDVSGATTLALGLTQSDGDLVIADDVRVTAQTAISVTNGAAFTPTGSYQPIESAGEVTPTLGVGTAGDLLVLINTSNTTVNLADTGTQMLTAAAALGQYDSLTLWSDGTNWIELARADN